MNDALVRATSTILTITTAHLSAATCAALCAEETPVSCYPNEYGAFVYVRSEVPDDTPDDLAVVLRFAIDEGFAWIKFDRDADFVPGLPDFDW